ncbi:MAG: hypothetical protein IPJ84_08815 [Bdellovibrionales bacterium]|nr:hypothetical protein [Bdellovibrionales bacterium]
MIRTVFFSIAFLFASQAFSQVAVHSKCKPVSQLTQPFLAGQATVQAINSLEIDMDRTGAKMKLNVDLFEAGYGATPSKVVNVTENFSMAAVKTGMMIDWAKDPANQVDFQYIITQQNELHVTTAGPVPPGTYKADFDLVLISSYPDGRMATGVLKLAMTCDETYVY